MAGGRWEGLEGRFGCSAHPASAIAYSEGAIRAMRHPAKHPCTQDRQDSRSPCPRLQSTGCNCSTPCRQLQQPLPAGRRLAGDLQPPQRGLQRCTHHREPAQQPRSASRSPRPPPLPPPPGCRRRRSGAAVPSGASRQRCAVPVSSSQSLISIQQQLRAHRPAQTQQQQIAGRHRHRRRSRRVCSVQWRRASRQHAARC